MAVTKSNRFVLTGGSFRPEAVDRVGGGSADGLETDGDQGDQQGCQGCEDEYGGADGS